MKVRGETIRREASGRGCEALTHIARRNANRRMLIKRKRFDSAASRQVWVDPRAGEHPLAGCKLSGESSTRDLGLACRRALQVPRRTRSRHGAGPFASMRPSPACAAMRTMGHQM